MVEQWFPKRIRGQYPGDPRIQLRIGYVEVYFFKNQMIEILLKTMEELI
jgi:hypothetical protein